MIKVTEASLKFDSTGGGRMDADPYHDKINKESYIGIALFCCPHPNMLN